MSKATWALVGGSSLAARELREVFEERKLGVTLRLLSGEAASALLTQEGEEAAVIEPLSAEALESAPVVFLAGAAEQNRATLELMAAAQLTPVVIDCTGTLEDAPGACLRAPMVEAEPLAMAAARLQVIAHPAAAVLARFLLLLHRGLRVEQAVVTVCEPASTQGQAGIEEMHQQTMSLLTFKPLPKDLYDAQVAFNLMPRYGEQAKVKLADTEKAIERHLVSLLAPHAVPLPSLRLIHAPAFHGYTFSVWVRFGARTEAAALEELFRRESIDLRTHDHEPASNLGVAGQSGFTVSDIQPDSNCPEAAWFFVAADNLRVTAENAAMVAGLSGGLR